MKQNPHTIQPGSSPLDSPTAPFFTFQKATAFHAAFKRGAALLLALALLASLSACGSFNGSKDTQDGGEDGGKTGFRIVTDALGREVELPETVTAIVPLGNTPRMIAYLGLADKVVGISGPGADKVTPLTAYAYVNKDRWAKLPVVGTDAFGNVDYYPEVILSVKPDVIFCTYPEDMVRDLESKTGLPVVSVSQGTLFEKDYEQSLRILGQACGAGERAEVVISYIKDTLADLQERTAHIPARDKPSALSAAATFRGAHGIEGVRLKDPVLAAINANNAAQAAASGNAASAEVDREQILAWNPAYIFCDYGGVALVKQDAAKNPDFYSQLDAFQNRRIYQYPSSTSYFSNVELSLANCYFAGSQLYPKAFADVDAEAKANEIVKFFLGADDYMSVLNQYGASYGEVKFGDKR